MNADRPTELEALVKALWRAGMDLYPATESHPAALRGYDAHEYIELTPAQAALLTEITSD